MSAEVEPLCQRWIETGCRLGNSQPYSQRLSMLELRSIAKMVGIELSECAQWNWNVVNKLYSELNSQI